jgi:hypothetical protein
MDASPGELANVDTSKRLCIPMGVLVAVPWWKAKAMEVKAELVRVGLMRIYSVADWEALSGKLGAGVTDIETVTALIDRYRTLKLTAEGRLGLIKEVAVLLGFALDEQPTLYAQATPSALVPPAVEIMTLAYRHERLSKLGEPLLRFNR